MYAEDHHPGQMGLELESVVGQGFSRSVLEPEPDADCGSCWGGLGRPARVSGAFQPAVPVRGLRVSEFVSLSFLQPLPVINPTGFQNPLRGLIFPEPVPRAGNPNVGLNIPAPKEGPPSL